MFSADKISIGTEWIVDARDCAPAALRDLAMLQGIFARVIDELELKVIGEIHWHQFPSPGCGVTGLAMLTESHLACHTYPEHGVATFNLYCCRVRPAWDWATNLSELLNAQNVSVQMIERAATIAANISLLQDAAAAAPQDLSFQITGGAH